MSGIKGQSVAIFAGNQENRFGYIGRNGASQKAWEKEKQNTSSSSNTIFAGNLKGNISETIQKKKALARKEAAKIVSDQIERDDVSTQSIRNSQQHQQELLETAKEAGGQLQYLKQAKEELAEMYGITDEYKPGSNKEYDERLKELNDQTEDWNKIYDDALLEIGAESSSIRAIKQALLGRTYTMADATEEAEQVLDAASKEIIALLRKDAMEHVQEELEEKVEQAEKAAEEKEEQEEKLENIKEEKEAAEEQTEKLHETVEQQSEMAEKIDEIKRSADLLDEDMKGLLVDVDIR
ncbi:MAG: hypothetical protein HDR01_15310 [Lachnospiraceae bacterium]|nr:hypothetical protein [Lachnospiraceae bacterium]